MIKPDWASARPCRGGGRFRIGSTLLIKIHLVDGHERAASIAIVDDQSLALVQLAGDVHGQALAEPQRHIVFAVRQVTASRNTGHVQGHLRLEVGHQFRRLDQDRPFIAIAIPVVRFRIR